MKQSRLCDRQLSLSQTIAMLKLKKRQENLIQAKNKVKKSLHKSPMDQFTLNQITYYGKTFIEVAFFREVQNAPFKNLK